jgi:PiT family inorganic phosphate transporter
MAAAITIGMATIAKVPISTTPAIGGAVSGVGVTRGSHAVRWIWGEKIVVAWIVTFPGAALIGVAGYSFAHLAIQPFIR